MTRILSALALLAFALPAAASDVGVSIGFEQQGIYGRIDIGRAPSPPVLVYPQPVVIAPTPVAVYRRPIYLHVPPGHAKNWGKHCARYGACGQPVYFVQDRWYRDVYVPVHYGGRDWEKYERKREKELRKREKEWRKHEKRHHKRHHHHDDDD